MNYAQVLAGELRGAFERQDHPAFTRVLARMVAAIEYTGPGSTAPHNDERVQDAAFIVPTRHYSSGELMKGTPNCMRADGCQCATWPQAKTCMHRR